MNDTRLYVQLAPDEPSVKLLHEIGASLQYQKSGRLLPDSELHITLIHFGVSRDILAAIRSSVRITDRTFMMQLEAYVRATKGILTDQSYKMTALEYGRFGERGKTLVVRYEPPSELRELHKRAYGELIHFLNACGVAQPEAFAKSNPNLRFAHTFNSHVTIYKGYEGPDPVVPLPSITVRFMPLEYPV